MLVLALVGCGGQEKQAEPLGPLGGDETSVPAEPSATAGTESADATRFDDEAHDVVRYVSYQRGKKLHTEGDTTFSVADIKVRGADATLSSCGVNKSVDVDVQGTNGCKA